MMNSTMSERRTFLRSKRVTAAVRRIAPIATDSA
ncbi:Uncharacterised protein [Mycobacteroides abscessus subsp. abscessus]|nr:Uncharacterised protein [Mycobacteroides abscessus subsp. abscessus]